jgi:hypothetical protein
MAAGGLDALAVEAGPLAMDKLKMWAGERDGRSKPAAWKQQNPDSIAFFDLQQEFALLSHCEQADKSTPLQIWGLDQEFLGSPVFLLRRLIEARAGAEVTAQAQKLLEDCLVETKQSQLSGDWKIRACYNSLPRTSKLYRPPHCTPATGKRSNGLRLSLKHNIFILLIINGHAYEANRERALLLKHNFLTDYQQLAKSAGHPPRILLKFGANHLYKGIDMVNLGDLGNFLSEFTDGQGSSSLHVAVFGMRGEEEHEIGPGRPDRAIR